MDPVLAPEKSCLSKSDHANRASSQLFASLSLVATTRELILIVRESGRFWRRVAPDRSARYGSRSPMSLSTSTARRRAPSRSRRIGGSRVQRRSAHGLKLMNESRKKTARVTDITPRQVVPVRSSRDCEVRLRNARRS